MPKNIPTIKLSRLLDSMANEIKLLKEEGIDSDISFSGLRFENCENRGKITQVQFQEQVYLDAAGKVVVETPEE